MTLRARNFFCALLITKGVVCAERACYEYKTVTADRTGSLMFLFYFVTYKNNVGIMALSTSHIRTDVFLFVCFSSGTLYLNCKRDNSNSK